MRLERIKIRMPLLTSLQATQALRRNADVVVVDVRFLPPFGLPRGLNVIMTKGEAKGEEKFDDSEAVASLFSASLSFFCLFLCLAASLFFFCLPLCLASRCLASRSAASAAVKARALTLSCFFFWRSSAQTSFLIEGDFESVTESLWFTSCSFSCVTVTLTWKVDSWLARRSVCWRDSSWCSFCKLAAAWRNLFLSTSWYFVEFASSELMKSS